MEIISVLNEIDRLYDENEECIIISKVIIKAINEFMSLDNPTCQKSEVLLNSLCRVVFSEEKKEQPRKIIYDNNEKIEDFEKFMKSLTQDKEDRLSKMFNKIKRELGYML
jgi:hypothetical protein